MPYRDRQKQLDYFKAYSKKNYDRRWGQMLKRNYNITVEEYKSLFLKQSGNCAICGLNQSNFKKKLYVDHNHDTGKNRELLCVNCNMLIGHAMERLDILEKSIAYLKKWNTHQKK
jgi:hypothetical protein